MFQGRSFYLLAQLVYSFNVAFAFLMVVEDALVHEGFVAGNAVKLARSIFVVLIFFYGPLRLTVDPADGALPAKQTALLPLAFKHLRNRVIDLLLEVD